MNNEKILELEAIEGGPGGEEGRKCKGVGWEYRESEEIQEVRELGGGGTRRWKGVVGPGSTEVTRGVPT